MDREKVIKGLDICLKNIESQDCPSNCPYFSDCSKYENRVVFQPLMRDALELLKAKPPKSAWIHRADMDYKDKNGVVHFHGMCKNCGFIHDFIDGHTGQYKFCPECGSKNEQWKDGDGDG